MQWRHFITKLNVFYLMPDYRASTQCIRTMTCDYALCSLFAPGDRHVIIGTKVRNCCSVWCYSVRMLLKVSDANKLKKILQFFFVHKSSTVCVNFNLPMTG